MEKTISRARLTRQEEETILRQGEVLKGLIEHPGWIVLKTISQAQQNEQIQALVGQQGSRDEDQYRKGVIFGQRLTFSTPELVVEHRDAILRERRGAEGSAAGAKEQEGSN